jgi:hydroxyacylglutathione hydrolase
VPGSIHIGLRGEFASWAGTLIPAEASIVVVAEDEARIREAVTRLARVGLEGVVGFLLGGVAAWRGEGRPVGVVPQIGVADLRERLRTGTQLVDVRRPAEYRTARAPGAISRPLDRLEGETAGVDPARPTAVICASGYRSSIGASLLLRAGVAQAANVVGGTNAWVAAAYEVESGT